MALIFIYDATELDKKQLGPELTQSGNQVEYISEQINTANLNKEAEIISVFVTSDVTREMIEAMPKLKLIACRSTGYNNIDMDAAKKHGVTIVNVPTYGEATVAEYAFALLLSLTRKLRDVFEAERRQTPPTALTGHDLEGKTFGVIGTGHIGQKALKIADGFSMKTIAYDSFPKKELAEELGFTYVSLDELLAQSDIVSIHVPFLPTTRHMMNKEAFDKMKRGSVLINTARGEIVETKCLIEALVSGQLGGAAIDVVESEELLNFREEAALLRSHVLPESILRHSVEISMLEKMPNVVISPHNAFNTIGAINRINQTTIKNISSFLTGNIQNKVEATLKPPGKLLVVRHGESEWNATGRWSGTRDIHLNAKGFREAGMFGLALRDMDITIDKAYCSEQIRSRETLEGMLDAAQQFDVEVVVSGSINERDYGEYTGKNKWQMKEILGEKEFNDVRRGWDVPVPGGETLKTVYARVVPFYQQTILPELLAGKNILIVAHGNSIRALKKYLKTISDEDVSNLEMPFGEIDVFSVDDQGLEVSSSVVKIETRQPEHY